MRPTVGIEIQPSQWDTLCPIQASVIFHQNHAKEEPAVEVHIPKVKISFALAPCI